MNSNYMISIERQILTTEKSYPAVLRPPMKAGKPLLIVGPAGGADAVDVGATGEDVGAAVPGKHWL